MEYRNAQYTQDGKIDCEINHPKYGWIPFTASPDDVEGVSREVFNSAKSTAGPYVPPPEPTAEELLERERAAMKCSRRQGKLALGEEKWKEVLSIADDPEMPWGLRVAVHDTYEWHRNSEEMSALIWAMGLTPEEADDLFRAAMKVST